MDRNYYGEHALTVARHPSETDERMMVRLLAFALNAHEHLAFGRGLSDTDEPDLWQRDLTGRIEHWIEVGQPDERRTAARLRPLGAGERCTPTAIARSCGGSRWPNGSSARRTSPCGASLSAGQALEKLAARAMELQCTVQEGQLWFSVAAETVQIELAALKGRAEDKT